MISRHLKENNMGYVEHLVFAASHGFAAIVLGLALLVHAVIPPIFTRAGATLLARLLRDFTPPRRRA